jgi:sialate O-acetylesterase
MSKDGKSLTHFTIAGADQKFVPAEALIKGHTVIVSSPQVTRPVAVRFAWHETAMPNLFNKAGLPAVPFRTDEWPMPPHTVKPKP